MLEEISDSWETFKENAAPLERGRDSKTLSKSLQSMRTSETEKIILERKKRAFENKLKDAELEDPIITWLEYIKFVQENFPSDTQESFLLMERCVRKLIEKTRYHQDTRFIRICILYADQTSFPSDVYKFLHQNKIGVENALFWVAWAWVAEKAKDFTFAEKIFIKAKRKVPQPCKLLEDRHKQFHRRMSKHWLNLSKSQNNEDPISNTRGALTSLASDGVRSNRRAEADNEDIYIDENTGRRMANRTNRRNQIGNVTGISGQRNQSSFGIENSRRNKHNNQGNSKKDENNFQIYVEAQSDFDQVANMLDQSTIADPKYEKEKFPRRKLPKNSDVVKENTMKAERWNERGGLHNSSNVNTFDEIPEEHNSYPEQRDFPQRSTIAYPSFAVFVDEDCDNENEDKVKVSRKKVTSQALRQRKQGVADKLVNDPLRYVRNPDKLWHDRKSKVSRKVDAGQLEKISGQKNTQIKSGKVGYAKHLVSPDPLGQETCFEEHRASKKCFTVSFSDTNMNLLSMIFCKKQDNTDSSIMSISMDMSESDPNNLSGNSFIQSKVAPEQHPDIVSTKLNEQETKKEKQYQDTSLNTSSSTIGDDKDDNNLDPTINTQFALRELSTMFSSPFNSSKFDGKIEKKVSPLKRLLDDEEPFDKDIKDNGCSKLHGTKDAAGGETATFSIFADLLNDDESQAHGENSTLTAEHNVTSKAPKRSKTIATVNDENAKPENHEIMNIRTIKEKKKVLGASSLLDNVGQNRPKSPRNPGSGQPDEINTEDTGDVCTMPFPIFADEVIAARTHEQVSDPSEEPITLYVENTKENAQFQRNFSEEGVSSENYASISKANIEGFNVSKDSRNHLRTFEEEMRGLSVNSIDEEMGSEMEKGLKKKIPNEVAFRDGILSASDDGAGKLRGEKIKKHKKGFVENGDTATLSLFNEAIYTVDQESFWKKQENKQEIEQSAVERNLNNNEVEMKEEKQLSLAEKLRMKRRNRMLASKKNLSSLEDDEAINAEVKKCIMDCSVFEDISHIEHDTSNEDIIALEPIGISYDRLHKKDIEWAHSFTKNEASNNARVELESFDTMEWTERNIAYPFLIEDKSTIPIPKGLTKKVPTKGTSIDLRGAINSTVTVKNELGRGGYGVVLLCSISHPKPSSSIDIDFVAMKVQIPTGSLAWEYFILTKLGERLSSPGNSARNTRNSVTYEKVREKISFPKPMCFSLHSDGALLAMDAVSSTGLTLVDLVNSHLKAGVGAPPELLAMHYTEKMLLLIETMHWHAKILHCDVKPDNWVLTSEKIASGSKEEHLEGADIVLVDFGRAIDLEKVAENTGKPALNHQFSGNISADEFACVAMREGKPWGSDIDTFGVCATAHILLYGTHMKVQKNNANGRWTQEKTLRRYWNRNLWNKLFDTLLNAKPTEESVNSSHPDSLRAIRKEFEAFLNQNYRRQEITSLLRHQVQYFPITCKKLEKRLLK